MCVSFYDILERERERERELLPCRREIDVEMPVCYIYIYIHVVCGILELLCWGFFHFCLWGWGEGVREEGLEGLKGFKQLLK